MGDELIRSNSGDRALLCPLRIVKNGRGDILHALKASDETFTTFGEAYFSSVVPGVVKGWKKHTRMTLNLIVPLGEVKFVIFDEKIKKFLTFSLSQKNYQRLTIPPNLWLAFKGLDEVNMVLNIASIEHDASECINCDIQEIPYEW